MNYKTLQRVYLQDVENIFCVGTTTAKKIISNVKNEFRLGNKGLLYAHLISYYHLTFVTIQTVDNYVLSQSTINPKEKKEFF